MASSTTLVAHTSATPLLAQAQAVASSTASSLAHLSGDALGAIAVVALLTFYILWRGKDEGFINLLALVVAGFVVSASGYLDTWTADMSGGATVGAYAGALFLIFTIMRFVLGSAISTAYPGSVIRRWIGALMLALATTGLLLSYAFSVLDVPKVYSFSPQFEVIFGGPHSLFWTLAVALAVLAVMGW